MTDPAPSTACDSVPLTVAGSDPTGGAGIEGDLKVFLAHGLSGAAVLTALTDQDTRGVRAHTIVPASAVRRRLELVLDDLDIRGVKTGLLPSALCAREIAAALRGRDVPLVVDPVLAPTRGRAFLDRAGRENLRRHLFPLATLVTPNLPELALLLGTTAETVRRAPEREARKLLEDGAGAVLVKGGHSHGANADDLLVEPGGVTTIRKRRIHGSDVHGTGCALSAAILARLILGSSLAAAAREAKEWVHQAIRDSRQIGRGANQLRFGEPGTSAPPRSAR